MNVLLSVEFEVGSVDRIFHKHKCRTMNSKKIIFSGIVTGVIGIGLGFVILYLLPAPYTGKSHENLRRVYTWIGSVAGVLIGSSLETIRQLKQQQDEDEALAEQFQRAKAAFPQFNTDTTSFIPPEKT